MHLDQCPTLELTPTEIFFSQWAIIHTVNLELTQRIPFLLTKIKGIRIPGWEILLVLLISLSLWWKTLITLINRSTRIDFKDIYKQSVKTTYFIFLLILVTSSYLSNIWCNTLSRASPAQNHPMLVISYSKSLLRTFVSPSLLL